MYDNNRERFENLWMRPWIMYCIVNICQTITNFWFTGQVETLNTHKQKCFIYIIELYCSTNVDQNATLLKLKKVLYFGFLSSLQITTAGHLFSETRHNYSFTIYP